MYPVVKIGDKYWMAENLKVTKYRDGQAIQYIPKDDEWTSTNNGAYCWYDNNINTNKNNYGALYNFYVVESNKICPAGWHVPTNDKWRALFDYLGGTNIAGGKLKETGTGNWYPPNAGATNESGFNARPAGNRQTFQAKFANIGTRAGFWSSMRMAYYLSNSEAMVRGTIHAGNDLKTGYSIRCVKD